MSCEIDYTVTSGTFVISRFFSSNFSLVFQISISLDIDFDTRPFIFSDKYFHNIATMIIFYLEIDLKSIKRKSFQHLIQMIDVYISLFIMQVR